MQAFAREALAATGYISPEGRPAEGLLLSEAAATSSGDAARLGPILKNDRGGLGADAIFRVGTSPAILFKSSTTATREEEAEWHRIAWNFGAAPILWVTTPRHVKLYNAYQPPEEYGHQPPLLKDFPYDQGTFKRVFRAIDRRCGRRHVAMGAFWRSRLARPIDREHRVDNVLLRELEVLLTALVRNGLQPSLAQKLVGRCIFFQYLVHRGHVPECELPRHFGAPDLHSILTSVDNTYKVFRWIRLTFNGDLFPIEDEASEREQLEHSPQRLQPLSDFFGHFNITDGQGRLFPFKFNVIPVELISSIYEKFAHMARTDGAPTSGIHYTPINLVDFVLDPLFEEITADTRVLDLACGSGVFLVESLRRLAWHRSRGQTLDRATVNDILTNQVRGVDVSPAALSVAAFSLYLAVLELAPPSPRDLDSLAGLRFEPLLDRVLFAASAFDPGLENRLPGNGSDDRFDIIVGNPPWTYEPMERASDRESARKESRTDRRSSTRIEGFRSGTTYARQQSLKIPPRSPDWAFLWRCRDFAHPETRVALVMKATPFFSLATNTSSARDALFRAFPNVTLVNLSQLRTSRLFQEYKDGAEAKRRKRRTAGPALIFLSNCLPTKEGCVSVMELPWSSTFDRTGVFELPADPPKALQLDSLKTLPGLLKAAAFGTDRDVWLLDRLSRNPRLVRFDLWIEQSRRPAGTGLQPGNTMKTEEDLLDLPRATAGDVEHGRLPDRLPAFRAERVHRSRDPSIYKGPLVLLPEGALANAPAKGRYVGVFDERSIAYNESFFGVSFFDPALPPDRADKPALRGRALAAIMYSRLVAYQLAFMGGTVGIKQTKVEVVDLDNVRIPRIDKFGPEQLQRLSDSLAALTERPKVDDVARACRTIDRVVEDAAALTDGDRRLLEDADRRTAAVFFETRSARNPMLERPGREEIRRYAENVCMTFNAFASGDDDCALVAHGYTWPPSEAVVVKFTLTTLGGLTTASNMEEIPVDDSGGAVPSAPGDTELPYLMPAKAARFYAGQEIYFMKPAQYRCFSPAAGQSDADRIIADLMTSTPH